MGNRNNDRKDFSWDAYNAYASMGLNCREICNMMNEPYRTMQDRCLRVKKMGVQEYNKSIKNKKFFELSKIASTQALEDPKMMQFILSNFYDKKESDHKKAVDRDNLKIKREQLALTKEAQEIRHLELLVEMKKLNSMSENKDTDIIIKEASKPTDWSPNIAEDDSEE